MYKFWMNQFQLQGQEPLMWFLKAMELKLSFEVLAKDATESMKLKVDTVEKSKTEDSLSLLKNTYVTSLMIAGYAFENYLKGMIIKNKSKPIIENGNFKLIEHDLEKLANYANFVITEDEKIMFRTLHDYMLNRARYPIPLNEHEMCPSVSTKDKKIVPKNCYHYYHQTDGYLIYKRINELFVRFDKECPIE